MWLWFRYPRVLYFRSTKPAAKRGFKYGMDNDHELHLMGDQLSFPSNGEVCILSACRHILKTAAKAIVSPGHFPGRSFHMSLLHCSCGCLYEGLLHGTAEQLGVKLTCELQPYTACSMGKGSRKPSSQIERAEPSRAERKLQRVFVSLSGKKVIASTDGTRNVMIMRDELRSTLLYFASSQVGRKCKI